MDYKHTCDTIFTHFQGMTNNIYGFGRLFFFTHPLIFLPVHIRFYPSKLQVDGSLHKAMSFRIDTNCCWSLLSGGLLEEVRTLGGKCVTCCRLSGGFTNPLDLAFCGRRYFLVRCVRNVKQALYRSVKSPQSPCWGQ